MAIHEIADSSNDVYLPCIPFVYIFQLSHEGLKG
jgi:hypothetical protein